MGRTGWISTQKILHRILTMRMAKTNPRKRLQDLRMTFGSLHLDSLKCYVIPAKADVVKASQLGTACTVALTRVGGGGLTLKTRGEVG